MISFSASSLQTRNFEFTNTKFQVYKLEILSLQTRNFKFTNSKFRVYKHEISSLQTRNFEFTNKISSLQKVAWLPSKYTGAEQDGGRRGAPPGARAI